MEEQNSPRTSARVPTQPLQDRLAAAQALEAASAGSPKKRRSPRMRKVGISFFIFGLLALIAGAGFLAYNLTRPPIVTDAEFLVGVKTWQRTDEPSVRWDFSEIGKGSLTTNAGQNTYDFIWALEDGELKIDTAWLYTLNNEFAYSLDQTTSTLTLTSSKQSITFVPASSDSAADPVPAEPSPDSDPALNSNATS